MAGFIYAIDNEDVFSDKVRTETGLSNIIDAADNVSTTTFNGPNGKCLLVMGAGGNSKKLKYLPDEQTWKEAINGKYRIGFYNNDRPTESELARPRQLDFHPVELFGGEKWKIALARRCEGFSALPQSLILDGDGQVQPKEISTYSEFYQLAIKLWDDFVVEIDPAQANEPETPPQLNIAERLKLAIMALGFNYHVGIDEVNALELISSENLKQIMAAIIDLPTIYKKIEADNKKKD